MEENSWINYLTLSQQFSLIFLNQSYESFNNIRAMQIWNLIIRENYIHEFWTSVA